MSETLAERLNRIRRERIENAERTPEWVKRAQSRTLPAKELARYR